MTRLSGEIDQANRGIGELATQLLRYLPLAQEQASGIRSTTSEFSAQLASELTQLEACSAVFEQRVTLALQRGDARLSTIADCSNDALSHLAFQDACAQRLFSVDAVLGRLCQAVLDGLADPSQRIDSVHFSAVQRSAALYAGEVVALQSGPESASGEAPAAGEVVMF
jgi:hypothetical protein